MNFNFLDWFIGDSLGRIASGVYSANWKTLKHKFDNEIDKWAAELPKGCRLVSISMYLNINAKYYSDSKALKAISTKINSGQIPSKQMIFEALSERWVFCGKNQYSQEFFRASEEQADIHLQILSDRLLKVLLAEKDFFQSFVHEKLLEINDYARTIKQQLDSLSERINHSEKNRLPVKRNLRDLPICHIPVLPDEDSRATLLNGLLRMSLFEVFRNVKYRKFTCIFDCQEELFNEDGKSIPGLSLVSGEVTFLGTCRKLVNQYCFHKKDLIQEMERMYKDPEFNSFTASFEYGLYPKLVPYDIEIDGQNKTFSIRLSKKSLELDYNNLHSLNSVLPFIAGLSMLKLHVVDHDKIQHFPPIMKLIYKTIHDSSIDLKPLQVNVDDFDDWDYNYSIQKD